MIRALGHRFAAFFRATTPDPFVLAIGLTVLVFALAAFVEGASPLQVIRAWQGDAGLFGLLAFTMQMVLILVTGHALASAPAVSRILARAATLPRSGAQAVWLVSSVAIATALLNWGLGLVVGAILAREVGRSAEVRGVRIHYPLVAAAGYTGLLCWHGGISGSAPLMMTTEANVVKFLGEGLARDVGTLSFSATVFSGTNVLVTGGLLVLVPLLAAAMAPRTTRQDDDRADERAESMQAYLAAQRSPDATPSLSRTDQTDNKPDAADAAALTWPERLERSRIVAALLALPLAAATVVFFVDHGVTSLDPNALNLAFLTLGLVLHGTPGRYVAAVHEAVRGASGIILVFPFYAGIMGVVRTTGLAATLATGIGALATPKTFGLLTMLSAGVVNLFVPSGGGQWAVQGPIAVAAARALDVPVAQAVMAVAYGDQLTNMLQPFWAMPLLAITGVRARDLIGYTAVLMIAAALYMGACLVLTS